MSLFAGMLRLDKCSNNLPLDESSIATIIRTMSREKDAVETFRSNHFFIAKVDVGAFSEPAFLAKDKGSVAAVSGHPLLQASQGPIGSRRRDLADIIKRLDEADKGVLLDCRGSFTLCYYQPSTDTLLLAVDKVGVRPLYYYLGERYLFFSSCLRILEDLDAIPKSMDLQGVTELAAIGYSLGNRTGYAEIKLLRNGEYLACNNGVVHRKEYFRWDGIIPSVRSLAELLDQAYEEFITAVDCRIPSDASVVCTLSGGLDSRCVATALDVLSKRIFAITFDTPGYQDGEIARRYARAIGANLICRTAPAFPTWDDWADCMGSPRWPGMIQPENKRLLFSGDGGSVGVGFVHVEQVMMALMRQNRVDQVVKRLLENWKLPSRFMTRQFYRMCQEALENGVRAELDGVASADRGRDLHIFFLQNDQMRHLHEFYENIDRYRIDFQLPFFDSNFLELLVSVPAETFLGHEFYHQWIQRFPKKFCLVPWQTYPGHLPCPVAAPVGLRNQTNKARADTYSGKTKLMFKHCVQSLSETDFPVQMVRSRVLAACALHALRVRNYGYVFATCNRFHHYYSTSKGSITRIRDAQRHILAL